MRVLVTGATGAIGREVVSALSQQGKASLYTTSAHDYVWKNKEAQHIKCNLLDADERFNLLSSVKPDCLIHLAWGKFGSKVNNSEHHLLWLQGSIELASLFGKFGGKRFIGCGSLHEYAPVNTERFEDSTPVCSTNNVYCSTKLALCFGLSGIAKIHNFSWVWPRLSYVIGPDCSEELLVGEAEAAIRHNREMTVSLSDDTCFDFIDSEDLGKLFAEFVHNDFSGIVNFSSGRLINVKDLISRMFAVNGCSNLLKFNPVQPGGRCSYLSNAKLRRLIAKDFCFQDPFKKLLVYVNGKD